MALFFSFYKIMQSPRSPRWPLQDVHLYIPFSLADELLDEEQLLPPRKYFWEKLKTKKKALNNSESELHQILNHYEESIFKYIE